MSELGQYEIAASIFRAICEYKMHRDNVKMVVPSVNSLIPKNILDKQKQLEENQKLAQIKEEERLKAELAAKKAAEEKANAQQQERSGSEIIYRVQFASMKSKLSTSDSRFAGLEDVWLYEFDGYWKYCAGLFATQKEASNYVQKVRSLGHKDAFVVVFHNGKRISFEQARALEKK